MIFKEPLHHHDVYSQSMMEELDEEDVMFLL